MRLTLIVSLIMGLPGLAWGQVRTQPGAQWIVNGDPQIIVHELDWQQEGDFIPDQSEVILRGGNSTLSGNNAIFYRLTLDKDLGSILTVNNVDLSVSDNMTFTFGSMNLNGNALLLGTTGTLIDEREGNRIYNTGASTARIEVTRTLNAPFQFDPGNIGVIVTSDANMGLTTIQRRFTPQAAGVAVGIARYFEADVANNAALDATLRFRYFDSELNGLTETELEAFFSINAGASYDPLGFVTRSAVANFVEITQVPQIPTNSLWTLADFNAVSFPVEWLDFTAMPVGDRVHCVWNTGSELNSDYFEAERSPDGVAFEVFATRPAAGNSQELLTYDAWDNAPYTGRSWYRIKQVDLDGSLSYSPRVEVYFAPEMKASLYPNPATDSATLKFVATQVRKVNLRLLDARGRITQSTYYETIAGENQFLLDTSELAEGVYTVQLRGGEYPLAFPLIVR